MNKKLIFLIVSALIAYVAIRVLRKSKAKAHSAGSDKYEEFLEKEPLDSGWEDRQRTRNFTDLENWTVMMPYGNINTP